MSQDREQLLVDAIRERFGASAVVILRDVDDNEPWTGSGSPADSTEAWRAELLDRWAA